MNEAAKYGYDAAIKFTDKEARTYMECFYRASRNQRIPCFGDSLPFQPYKQPGYFYETGLCRRHYCLCRLGATDEAKFWFL